MLENKLLVERSGYVAKEASLLVYLLQCMSMSIYTCTCII